MSIDGTRHVRMVAYDPHGRRTMAQLGNGVLVRYRYDQKTFRLARLHSAHAAQPTPDTWRDDGPVLQDCTFRYDLAGNLLALGDRTPGCGIPPGDPNSLDRRFSHDALYRLTQTSGRETDLVPNEPWLDTPRSQDLSLARAYTETYGYDAVGGLLELRHATDSAGTGAFTRRYTPANGSNRLAKLEVGSFTATYTYDACGNVTAETDSRRFEWDHANRLATFRVQASGAEPSRYAQYRYDSSGTRAIKLVRSQNGASTVTIYLGPGFERLLRTTAGATTVHDSLFVVDVASRLATIRRGEPLPDDPMPTTCYILSDRLGSSTAVTDSSGGLLSSEEYTPYGETSFGGYARKRYRFTAKERDEETGFYYYGARYYAPWLARWRSSDPAGHVDGSNVYAYVRGSPMRFIDATGLWSYDPAAAGARIDELIDAGASHAMMEDRNVGTSLYNTAIATGATVLKGFTSILRVGTGAGEGVDQIQERRRRMGLCHRSDANTQ